MRACLCTLLMVQPALNFSPGGLLGRGSTEARWKLQRAPIAHCTEDEVHAKLTIVRHGQSEWNLANRFTGWSMLVHARTTDVSLSTVRAVAQKSFEPDGYVCLRVCVYAVDVDLTERGITEIGRARVG